MRKVLDPLEADVLILNTCSVRQKGEDRVFGFVAELEKHVKEGGKRPSIGITGCMVRKTGMARRYLEEDVERETAKKIELLESAENLFNCDDRLFPRLERLDFTFRIEEMGYLTKLLSIVRGEEIGNDSKFNEYLQVRQVRDNPGSGNVIIQTGCDNYCTYCIVPHTRGRETSRGIDEIANEVRSHVQDGAKEVTLLGQNVNSYGKTTKKKLWNEEELRWNSDGALDTSIGKTPFRELLEAVNDIEGLDRIRFTSSNPHDMTRDVLDAHFELPKLCNYLHFALQSGDDGVLRKMNRKHTYADFRQQVEYLRSKDPLFSISTDIIVGFPGETEEAFQNTVRAFRECEFDFAYIARYSERKGTRAGDAMEDDVSLKEKARRWAILNSELELSVRKRSELLLGRTEEVLVMGQSDKNEDWYGRTRNFKEVYFAHDATIAVGDIVLVRIEELDRWVLKGTVVTGT